MKTLIFIILISNTVFAIGKGSNPSPSGRLGGASFYQARTLLQIIKQQFIEFTDSCNIDKPSGARIVTQNDEGEEYIQEIPENFVVFPNPNNGNFQVLYSLNESKQASIKVFDVNGKLVFVKPLDANSNLTQLNLENISKGVYYYQIIGDDSTLLKSDKLIIIK